MKKKRPIVVWMEEFIKNKRELTKKESFFYDKETKKFYFWALDDVLIALIHEEDLFWKKKEKVKC